MQSVHDIVGSEFFVELVDRFYDGVAADDRLRAMYPETDLTGARARLAAFLIQYWGGPATYSEERGHPRLRMRHGPFAVGPRERDAWLDHMTRALDEMSPPPEVQTAMLGYFRQAAQAMVNWDGSSDVQGRLRGDVG